MKVRMKKQSAGPAGSHAPGAIRTVDEEEGRALIAAGAAEEVEAPAAAAAKAAPARSRGKSAPKSGGRKKAASAGKGRKARK